MTPARSGGFPGDRASSTWAALPSGLLCMFRERLVRSRAAPLAFQGMRDASGFRPRRRVLRMSVAGMVGVLGALAGFFGCLAARGRRKLHAGPARLGEPDRNRLLGRLGAVLAAADVVHLFADELAGLG